MFENVNLYAYRGVNESFKDYKNRLKLNALRVKHWLKGKLIHNSWLHGTFRVGKSNA